MRLDNRENARIVEMCYKTHTTMVNPIIDWTDAEVWEFIREYNIPYCELYDQGFKRLGCIGCPMGTVAQREYEFERYPKYKTLYLKAFQKMIDNHSGGGGEPRNKTQEKYYSGGYSSDANDWLYWYIYQELPRHDSK